MRVILRGPLRHASLGIRQLKECGQRSIRYLRDRLVDGTEEVHEDGIDGFRLSGASLHVIRKCKHIGLMI